VPVFLLFNNYRISIPVNLEATGSSWLRNRIPFQLNDMDTKSNFMMKNNAKKDKLSIRRFEYQIDYLQTQEFELSFFFLLLLASP